MAVRHKHIAELQSFRGIAALIVLLQHCSFYFAMPDRYYPIVETFFNSHAAVIGFFVLSGYVLTNALMQEPIGRRESARFLLRRVFRLYPAIFVMSIISLLLLLLVDHSVTILSRSDWASLFYRPVNQTFIGVAASLLGLGTFLIPPMWSITVELAGSVLVLLMAIISQSHRRRIGIFVFALVLLSFVASTDARLTSLLTYMVYFALGASVPLWCEQLGSLLRPRLAMLVALFCIVLMASFRLVGGWDLRNHFNAVLPGLVEGSAAAILVALLVACRNAFAIMRSWPLVRLGDISFSLYLVHFPIMVALATLGGGIFRLSIFSSWPTSAVALTIVTVVTSTFIARLSYEYVELPGIKLGNWFISWLLKPDRIERRRTKTRVIAG